MSTNATDPTDQTRTRLLEAAISMFRDRGYQGTTVSALLGATGLSKGAFYHYFESKQELLAKAIEEVAERASARIQPIIDGDGPSLERLRLILIDLVADIATAGGRIFNDPLDLIMTPQFEPARRARDRYEQAVRRLLEDCMKNGSLRSDLPAAVVVKGILGMAMSTTDWFEHDRNHDAHEVGVQFVDAVLLGALERSR